MIDAGGRFTTPGLVDLQHANVYGLRSRILADLIAARSGATTWIDAGTLSRTLDGFRRFIMERSRLVDQVDDQLEANSRSCRPILLKNALNFGLDDNVSKAGSRWSRVKETERSS